VTTNRHADPQGINAQNAERLFGINPTVLGVFLFALRLLSKTFSNQANSQQWVWRRLNEDRIAISIVPSDQAAGSGTMPAGLKLSDARPMPITLQPAKSTVVFDMPAVSPQKETPHRRPSPRLNLKRRLRAGRKRTDQTVRARTNSAVGR
jgi:hypothetical protein